MNARIKEAILLIAVAVVGLLGLLLLQITRNDGAPESDSKTLVQNSPGAATAPAESGAQSTMQKIPGDIVDADREIELNQPFTYQLKDFSPGAVYELDLGDGNRKSFENGKLTHTYRDEKGRTEYDVKLYAVWQGQTYHLTTIKKVISRKLEQPATNKKGKPIIDY